MEIYWAALGLATAVIVVVLVLAAYRAFTSKYIELEFKSIVATIRLISKK